MGKEKTIKIDDLQFDDLNANNHTAEGLQLLEKSITQNKFGRSVLVDKDGRIIAGNGVVESAKKLGHTKVRVIETDGDELIAVKRTDLSLDSKEGRELAIADNSIARVDLEWNDENLKQISEEWDIAPEDWGVDIPVLDEESEEKEEDEFEEGNTIPRRASRGDVFKLGEHRLMCGDSTCAEDVAELMDGNLADLLLTDPPYNVNYEGATKRKLKIQNDNMKGSDFYQFILNAMKCAFNNVKNGASFYVWYASKEVVNFHNGVEDAGFTVKQELIWNKNSLVMGRQDYQWKHEPCLYGWKETDKHYWYGDRKQTTVLDFDRPTRSDLHPTMKPIALFDYQMRNSTEKGDIVLDLFGGSGTTLIAAEQNGRKAFLMEYDEHYCDVIIDRRETLTGKEAVKL